MEQTFPPAFYSQVLWHQSVDNYGTVNNCIDKESYRKILAAIYIYALIGTYTRELTVLEKLVSRGWTRGFLSSELSQVLHPEVFFCFCFCFCFFFFWNTFQIWTSRNLGGCDSKFLSPLKWILSKCCVGVLVVTTPKSWSWSNPMFFHGVECGQTTWNSALRCSYDEPPRFNFRKIHSDCVNTANKN